MICIYISIIVWSEWNVLTVFCFTVLHFFHIIVIFLAILNALLVSRLIFLTSKPVMRMNFVVTLSDTLKLAKHGTYARFRQSSIVYSFMEEKNY